MKRYDLEDTGTPGQPELMMVEDVDGEWVKHEDICSICRGVGVHDVDEYYKD